jgi:hypothetical protein
VSSSPDGKLPTFVIIGAAKSGTSALHRYLHHHPEIFMSKDKELKLFSDAHWRDKLGWYRTQFNTELPVRGESSPQYSIDPWIPSVAPRIHEVMPDARLIYMVRDPIERLIAQYVEFVAQRVEWRPLNQALADYAAPDNPFVAASRYAHQLDTYRDYFPDSRILVVEHRELLHARADTLRTVFGFLGVATDFYTPEFEMVHNLRTRKLRLHRGGVWLKRAGILRRAREPSRVLPNPVREGLKRVVARPVPAPDPLDEHLRDELRGHLRPDTKRLRAYTGKPLAHWET